MACRKWVVRSLVFTLAAAMAGAGIVYHQWSNPAAVREQVLARLGVYLPGATVSLESADLSIFGGITVHNLRLARRDDSKQNDFAVFSTGTIYHDKEQLFHGKLAIRKLVFPHPKLHAIRRQDGSWNLQNILAAPDLNVAVPTIVFQDATLVLEDQGNGVARAPLEIRHFNMSVVNDPHIPPNVSTFTFEGSGVADVFGKVQINGTWSRKSGELTLSIQAPSFAVDGPLVERLSAYVDAASDARQLTGQGSIRLDLNYVPTADRKWSYEVHGKLVNGKLRHARLPFVLEDIAAKIRCVDGLITLDEITAKSGVTRLVVKDTTLNPAANWDLDGFVEAEHLELTDELFATLPAKLSELKREFQPKGSISLSAQFRRRGDKVRHLCVVRPEKTAIVFAHFRYPIHDVTGKIEHEGDEINPSHTPNRLTLKVSGFAGNRPVYLEGETKGKSPTAVTDLKIWGKDIVIDSTLCNALPENSQKLVQMFHPSGLVDVEAYIRQLPGESKASHQYVVRVHDASSRYELFPYPLENVAGVIDIQPDDHFEFRDFHGRHKGSNFYSHGRSDPVSKKITIEVTGTQVLLDDEMEAALIRHPSLQNTWKKLSPAGRLSFEAHVEQLQGQTDPNIAVMIRPLGISLRPEFFPYALEDLRGLVHYRRGEVIFKDVSARHGATMLKLDDGKAVLEANGNVSVDLVNLLGNPIVPDAELFKALPKQLGDACARLQLKEPLSLLTNMTIYARADNSPPYIYWDGGLRLKDATLSTGVKVEHVSGTIECRGAHQGKFGNVLGNLRLDQAVTYNQLFSNIYSKIVIKEDRPDILELQNLQAKIYGGELGGEVRLEFGPAFHYELNLIASQLRLEEFARRNNIGPKARLSGLANARLYLRGTGTDIAGLEGGGSIDVPNGKMGHDLPVLLDLVKVLSLHPPDRTAFEEARIRFAVRGPQVKVSELNLYGNSISLSGEGTVNLNGSNLNLDFYAFWGRLMQVSPPILDKIPPMISKQLLKIKMRGSIEEVKCTKEPVPTLVEPVKKLLNRMSGKE